MVYKSATHPHLELNYIVTHTSNFPKDHPPPNYQSTTPNMPSATTSPRGPAPRFNAYSAPITRGSSNSSRILAKKETNVVKKIVKQEDQGQKLKHIKQKRHHGKGYVPIIRPRHLINTHTNNRLKEARSFGEQEKQYMIDTLWSQYAEMNRELEDSEAEVEDVKAELQILNEELSASEFMKNVTLSRLGQVISTIRILEATPVI